LPKRGTIILDPGHGGTTTVGGSSPNNATSPSGVLEKDVTLAMVFLVRDAIARRATETESQVKVALTRETDVNVGLADRARLANEHDADLLLSIHCNASDAHNARGVETLVRPTSAGNPNHAEDRAFARTIQDATFRAVETLDANTRDRGVKEKRLGVLNDAHLGAKARACLVEIEFIDRLDVDQLLNTGPGAQAARAAIADALAAALVASLPEIA
jgi:N-acetylmuramoyl-L-alanine amidase